MSLRLVFRLALVLVTGCRTTAVRDDATGPRRVEAPRDAGAPLAVTATPPAQVDAGPPPPKEVTAFYPAIEGGCPSGKLFEAKGAPVLVVNRDAWTIGVDGPKPFYRMGVPYDAMSGTMLTANHVVRVGGATRPWVLAYETTGRGENASTLYLLEPPKMIETPHGQFGFFGITNVIEQPDGAVWVYGLHSMYMDIPGDPRDGNAVIDKWFAFSAAGEPLKTNLPGADMRDAVRLASGELVAPGQKIGKAMLRRWSPSKKVDDLVSPTVGEPTLLVGTERAVLVVTKTGAVYNYTGDKLEPSKVKVKDVASWTVTKADDLWITASDGTLVIETKDGTVTEEKVPEPGRLAQDAAPWFLANSGVVYRRGSEGWTKIALADGPWTNEKHPPQKIEWLKTAGGETWVSTVRTDTGAGQKKATEIRTYYSSAPRKTPMRCGAPFESGTIQPYFSAKADDSCKNLVVALTRELAVQQKNDYPKLGAPLKGDAALGASLAFVDYGDVERVLAIQAPSLDVAKEIVKKLPQGEIACATGFEEKRRLDFDPKTGKFTPH